MYNTRHKPHKEGKRQDTPSSGEPTTSHLVRFRRRGSSGTHSTRYQPSVSGERGARVISSSLHHSGRASQGVRVANQGSPAGQGQGPMAMRNAWWAMMTCQTVSRLGRKYIQAMQRGRIVIISLSVACHQQSGSQGNTVSVHIALTTLLAGMNSQCVMQQVNGCGWGTYLRRCVSADAHDR